ncbi:MAG: amidase family protein, partial [Pseudomonadota bacterium]
MQVEEFDISALQAAYADRRVSCAELCEAYLARIAAIDQAGPTLKSVIEINPDAMDIARSLDAALAARGPVGTLHGVPVMVKDSIDTGDGMMTTAGSLAMLGHVAERDAFAVAKLREAGALVLAKTNMSEWGYMRSTRGCSGWSSRGGQVRNPYALDRSPSGSSSGSAVAVAANLCTAALGAEVDGSVVRPSSINGIVGLKPTVGLLSRSGVIGVAEPQDTVGPMARTVTDLAIVLDCMTGHDPSDPATEEGAKRKALDYRAFLRPDALRGARIGVARDAMGYHERTDAVMEGAFRVLRDLGAELVDPANGSQLPLFGQTELDFMLYQLKASTNRYLATHPNAPIRDLDELIRVNRERAAEIMPYFQQEAFEMAALRGGLDTPEHLRLL